MIEVIDNALPEWLFQRLKHVVQYQMPYWVGTITPEPDPFIGMGEEIDHNNQFGELFFNSFLSFRERFNATELLRCKVGIIPRDIRYTIHAPHIDRCSEHYVGLLYLNNTDGDTYIYKNKFDFEYRKNYNKEYNNEYEVVFDWKKENNLTNDDFEVEQAVTPKENRLVVFDGAHFHSSSTPTKTQMRWAINYNFI